VLAAGGYEPGYRNNTELYREVAAPLAPLQLLLLGN